MLPKIWKANDIVLKSPSTEDRKEMYVQDCIHKNSIESVEQYKWNARDVWLCCQ